jgi:hypothetical protein
MTDLNVHAVCSRESVSQTQIMALADDAPGAPPVKSPKQKMNDCMVQERA